MRKTNANALWLNFSPEQTETLDGWLFERKLSYAKLFDLARAKLGFKGSISSLKRYFQRRRQERLVTTMTDVGKEVAKVSQAGANPDELRVANMRVVGVYLFRALQENPDALMKLMPAVKAMLQNDYNQTLRESKAEDQRIRREALAFTKDKFQRDIIEQAVQALPDIQELVRLRQEPDATPEERKGYIDVVRQRLFGLGGQPQPESPEKKTEVPVPPEAEAGEQPARQPEAEPITQPESPVVSSQDDGEHAEMKVQTEVNEREGEMAREDNQGQAAVAAESAKMEEEKLREQQAAEQAEQQREERKRAKQKRLEEIREICGWQEVENPPGWGDGE